MSYLFRKMLVVLTVAQFAIVSVFATAAQAELISTEAAISKYAGLADREFLLSEIQRDDVRAEMEKLGVDPAEAEARLAALTDAEIKIMVAQMDENTAGGSILGTIATIFIILLVTDLACWTKFFNFTRCVR